MDNRFLAPLCSQRRVKGMRSTSSSTRRTQPPWRTDGCAANFPTWRHTAVLSHSSPLWLTLWTTSRPDSLSNPSRTMTITYRSPRTNGRRRKRYRSRFTGRCETTTMVFIPGPRTKISLAPRLQSGLVSLLRLCYQLTLPAKEQHPELALQPSTARQPSQTCLNLSLVRQTASLERLQREEVQLASDVPAYSAAAVSHPIVTGANMSPPTAEVTNGGHFIVRPAGLSSRT